MSVCPWWFAPTFDNPLRRLVQPPEKILAGMVQAGMQVVDLGCGMGYFTIPLARLVGEQGAVYAVDVQSRMLDTVSWRARRAKLMERIHLQLSQPEQIGLSGMFDFALAFWMLHETPNQADFLYQVSSLLKPGGRFFLVEPKVHVSSAKIKAAIQHAQDNGMRPIEERRVFVSQAVLFSK